jgi:hypothetical protein
VSVWPNLLFGQAGGAPPVVAVTPVFRPRSIGSIRRRRRDFVGRAVKALIPILAYIKWPTL